MIFDSSADVGRGLVFSITMASIVLLIVWVYYSGQIFFLGAEFTKVFADRHGSQPSQYPEAMVIEKNSPSPAAEELKVIRPPGVH
jgi:membrane protein